MKFFDLNNVPKTVSWIKKLTIEETREQCKLWGIKPKDKLDAMRVQLSEFVARSSEGVVSDLEESADEPRVPITDDLVDNPSLKQDEVGTCTVLPPVVPVDLGGLVKSLHTMTLNAIEATAKTVAQEIATQNRPYNRDDVSFPNILRDMLREVPVTSGTDLFQLTEFLVKIQKIVELNLGSDKTILLNAVARTEGRLRDVWMGLVSADSTWPNALQTIRFTFFSSRAIRDIQSKLMYRQQRLSEPYADYLTDIVSIFQILGPEISDGEIFTTTFTGLNPHTRAAFAGLQPPTTVQQLKNMVSMIESLTVNTVQAPLGGLRDETIRPSVFFHMSMSMAFGCVDHDRLAILLRELEHCDVRGLPYMWIKSFLQDRMDNLRIQSHRTMDYEQLPSQVDVKVINRLSECIKGLRQRNVSKLD
ncbi:hypothetical protein J6590_078612 [Homalodisca vitripennis]|nr:hypothetical protein J6590_078612 [Homalodisca vitripennis]